MREQAPHRPRAGGDAEPSGSGGAATRSPDSCGSAAARAWYTPEWEKRVEAAFGGKPTVTYYDNHVVVDNEAGKVKVEA